MQDTDIIPKLTWPNFSSTSTEREKVDKFWNELITYVFDLEITNEWKNDIYIEKHFGNSTFDTGYQMSYDGITLKFEDENYKTIRRIVKIKDSESVGEYKKRILSKFAEMEKLYIESQIRGQAIEKGKENDLVIQTEILLATKWNDSSNVWFVAKNSKVDISFKKYALNKERAIEMIKKLQEIK